MAEHMIETRILLRYDTLSNWTNSNIILKQGEAAIAVFPNQNESNSVPPPVGIKIGNGVNYFRELPWVQAVAADVYAWAKSSTKPTYSASEINGLAEYINQHSGSGSGGGSTSSAYRIIYDSQNNKYILQQYDDTTNTWIDTTSEINLNDIVTRIATIENWANGAYSNLGNITTPLIEYVSDGVSLIVGRLNVTDTAVQHQFVTSVSENSGKISISRAAIDASDITTGVFTTEQGGTGFSSVGANEILIGSSSGALQKTGISNIISSDYLNNIPTNNAIISYVEKETAGLTGAMHFIGEASVTITENSHVNPQIPDYNFRLAKPGDVILSDEKEFVWTGSIWRLLGDEGSYAIKGSIKNADIAEDAAIAVYKIANLPTILENKVDVQEGKGLSTHDYTTEDRHKLMDIEEYAQVNTIEHIFVNDLEMTPITINGLTKSINIPLLSLSQEQIDKLNGIENNAQKNIIEHIFLNNEEIRPTVIKSLANSINLSIREFDTASSDKLNLIEPEAQVNVIEHIIYDGEELLPNENKVIEIISDPHTEHENKIESIVINNIEQIPDKDKQIKITLDEAALNLQVIKGARTPLSNGTYEDVFITQDKKLELARIAATGNIADITQTANTYVILDCGSSTEVL